MNIIIFFLTAIYPNFYYFRIQKIIQYKFICISNGNLINETNDFKRKILNKLLIYKMMQQMSLWKTKLSKWKNITSAREIRYA